MKFIELTDPSTDKKFLMDFHSGWEIWDKGEDAPAFWANNQLAMNMSVKETYKQIKTKLIKSDLLLELE